MSTIYQHQQHGSPDTRLDELLEDLQSTIAKPKMNGVSKVNGNSSGYRETYKSVSTQKNGLPPQTSKEYEIEYLKPSNPTSTMRERPASPFSSRDGQNYKTVSSYEYTQKRQGGGSRTGTPLMDSKFERSMSDDRSEFKHNIDQFDSLIDKDFNDFPTSSTSTEVKKFQDSSFPETIDYSTPRSGHHVSKIEKSYEERRVNNELPIRHTEVKKEVYHNGEPVERFVDKYSSGGGGSIENTIGSPNSRKKDLVFVGVGRSNSFNKDPVSTFRDPSPSPGRKVEKIYQYESKTSSTKRSNDGPPTSTTYSYESDVTDNYHPPRSPSPPRSIHNYSTILKETNTNTRRSPSPSPVQYYTSTSTVTHNVTPQPVRRALYQESKTVHETRTTRSPPPPVPNRTPSPIVYTPPPDPPGELSMSSYNFEKSVRSTSPPPRPAYTPTEVGPPGLGGQTLITRNYKYSSQTQNTRTVDEPPSPQRHFPPPSPHPEIKEQRPPKQLDDLMSSFGDNDSHYREYNRYESSRRSPTPTRQCEPAKSQEKIIPVQTNGKLNECKKTNGVAGPAVYYPPGPLFTKKEQCAMSAEQGYNAKGGMKANRKAMYKMEAGSKMKDKSKTKKTVVPLCAPVCCALPCVIM